MKILSCYIENFGCLSSETVTFGEGLFVRMRKNGEGKSTLLAFLRAMLYGMESVSASDKRFKERLHYRPFGGGAFGGTLTVEYKSESYRIERFFDMKSATKDTLTVYDRHGEQTDLLGDVPGVTLFGLDEDAFARTAFMTSEDIDATVPQSLGQRMCGFAFGAMEDNHFDRADAMLVEAMKRLHSERKSKGAYTGEIPEKERYLQEKIAVRANLKNKEGALAEKQDALSRANECLRLACEKREQIGRSETVLAQLRVYDSHVARAREAQETVLRLEAQYPHGIPSEEEIDAYRTASAEISRIDGVQNALTQSEEADQARERALRERFDLGAPTDADMQEAWQVLEAYDASVRELARIEATSSLSEQDARMVRRLDEKQINQDVLSRLNREKESMLKKQRALDAIDASHVQGHAGADKLAVIALLLAAVLLMAGTVSCVLFLPMGVAMIAGALLSGVLGVLRMISQKKKHSEALFARERAANSLDAEIKAAYDAYAAELRHYGYDDPSVGLHFLERDVARYEDLKSDEKQRTLRLDALTEEKKDREAYLLAFFARYRTPIGKDMTEAYYELKGAKNDFAFLTQRKHLSSKRTQENEERKKKYLAFKAALLHKYAQTEESFSPDLLLSDRETLTKARETAREEQEAAEACRKEYDLPNVRPQPYDGDLSSLDGEIQSWNRSILQLKREIEEIESDLEALGDTEAEIAHTEEGLLGLRETHACLGFAREELGMARRDLLDRYVEPIRQSYLSYAEKISPILCEGMAMNAELACHFERHGALRSASHLSMGERSAMALCLRLALLDGMYEGEKPPIFLDDPFMALDGEHAESTLRILTELAKDRQIIYLTCHESRVPTQH